MKRNEISLSKEGKNRNVIARLLLLALLPAKKPWQSQLLLSCHLSLATYYYSQSTVHSQQSAYKCNDVDNSNLLEKIATHVYNSAFKNNLSTSYTHFVLLYNLLKNKEVIDFEQRLYSYPQPLMLLLNFFKKGILVIWIMLFLLISCENKNSSVGFEQNIDFGTITIDDLDIFTNIYSFKETSSLSNSPDSGKIKVVNQEKLILGNYKGINAQILLRFSNNLPSKDFILQEDPIIKLRVNKIYPEQASINDFHLIRAVLLKDFNENFTNWDNFINGIYMEADITIENLSTSDDTLKFKIDKEIVQGWMEEETENKGIMLYADNVSDSFIEFYSRAADSNNRPKLQILDLKPEEVKDEEGAVTDTTYVAFDLIDASADTFIHNAKETSVIPQSIVISNILPRSIFIDTLDVNLIKTKFTAESVDLHRININQAYIEFSIDTANSLLPSEGFYVRYGVPRYVSPIIKNFDQDDMLAIDTASSLAKIETDNTIRFNLLGTVNTINNLLYYDRNNGLCIFNMDSNKDFSHLTLHNSPKIVIKYSILKD